MFRSKKKQQTNPNKEMSFLDHLEEFRWHLVRSLAVVAILMIVLFNYLDQLITMVVLAPFRPDFPVNAWLCAINDRLCFDKIDVIFQATEPYEQFTRAFFLAFVGGLVLGSPYILWEIWRFLKPGLRPTEKRLARWAVWSFFMLFNTGFAFGYFIITPFSVRFLSSFKLAPEVQNIWRIANVISLITEISIAGGLLFELPFVSFILSKFGILTPALMRKYRRHAVVVILIIAGILTPPDPLSQILLGVPMWGLYEISIFISTYVHRNKT